MEPRSKATVIWMAVLVVLLAATVVAETAYISHLENHGGKSTASAINISSKAATTSPSNGTSSFQTTPPQVSPPLYPEEHFWQDPYQAMQRMQERMDRMFNDSFFNLGAQGIVPAPTLKKETFAPPLNLTDQGNHYTVKLDLPGANKSKISVKIENNQLTVSGTRAQKKEQKNSAGHVIENELMYGKFQRAITLPGPVKNTGAKANYTNGVLTITIPKAKPVSVEQPHKIVID